MQRQPRSVAAAPPDETRHRTQDCPWATKGIPEAAAAPFPGSCLYTAGSERSNFLSFQNSDSNVLCPDLSLSALSALLGKVPVSKSFQLQHPACGPLNMLQGYLLALAPSGGVTVCALDPGWTPIFACWPLRLAKACVKRAPSDESPERPHRAAAVPEVPGIRARTPRLPPALPLLHRPGSAFAVLSRTEQPPAPLACLRQLVP